MRRIVIFGAGFLGQFASNYYNNKGVIAYYVDNDKEKWGSFVGDYEVKSPDVLLKDRDVIVIVPKYSFFDDVCEQLRRLGVETILCFEINEKVCYIENIVDYDDDTCVVYFKGGIGNQLFQYCMYLLLEKRGEKVVANLEYFHKPGSRSFSLSKVFRNVQVNECRWDWDENDIRESKMFYREPSVRENYGQYPDIDFLYTNYRYFDGYFQTYKFPQYLKNELNRKLIFDIEDKGLSKFIAELSEKNVVSVHIRRGDYKKKDNLDIYDGICTCDYYKRAFDYVSVRVENPVYLLLSDDIESVKREFDDPEVIYIDKELFDSYEDWYDMLIMSICKHNIIANSSFSWWGAWLNKNVNKIVIAPKHWVGYDSQIDICPPEWIRI